MGKKTLSQPSGKAGAVTQVRRQALDQIWTVPNILSYLRVIILLPATLGLIASGKYWLALVAAAALGLTDWFDGFLARRLDQESVLGAELDPVADRLSILLVAVVMTVVGLLPWYVLGAVLVVDASLFVLALVWFAGHPKTKVSWVGKVRTALLLTGIPLLLLGAAIPNQMVTDVALVLLIVGTIGHVVAGLQYAEQMWRQRKRRAINKTP